MFKKIALLAGAGALTFAAVAPMAAASVPDHGAPSQYSDCVNWYKVPADKLLLKVDAGEKIKNESYKVANKANQVAIDAASAKRLLEKNKNRTKKESATLAMLMGPVTTPGSVLYLENDADGAWATYASDLSNYLNDVADYNTYLLKFAQCQEQLEEHPNNCEYWSLLYHDASSMLQLAADQKADLTKLAGMLQHKAPKYTGEKAVISGKLNKVNAAISDATKAIKKYEMIQSKAVKGGKALNCQFSKNIGVAGPATGSKKVGDNKVNNAAAKEGHNGLAATGSAASVAALLSALAVLAGGAFVGIRRFNS